LSIPVKGLILIVILVAAAAAAAVPVFAYCPPDCAPKVNYQPGGNGTFANSNYTGSSSAGNFTSTISSIVVKTDKPSYNDGDKITVSGSVRDYIAGTPVSVIIRNPIGNVVYISQINLGNSTTYSTTISAGGSLWQTAGTYTISAQYGGPDRSTTTTFGFSGSKVSQAQNTFPVDGTNFSLTYTITNGKVLDIKADIQSKSLIVSIQTTGDGTLTITMPRALIDAKKTDGTDDTYFVLNNDQENDGFQEINTTSTDRTLSIPFSDGTESIQIIGTVAVPEFGPIVVLIFAIAIISIIAVSAKTGLRLLPKY
jgi:predicted secreted protein with PEFG-CTERM motif